MQEWKASGKWRGGWSLVLSSPSPHCASQRPCETSQEGTTVLMSQMDTLRLRAAKRPCRLTEPGQLLSCASSLPPWVLMPVERKRKKHELAGSGLA